MDQRTDGRKDEYKKEREKARTEEINVTPREFLLDFLTTGDPLNALAPH